jgi:hypothetical protein
MPVIDPRITWQKTEERLALETDPTLRRNLELLLQHQKAEAALDLEQLMATVSDNARYETFGDDGSVIVGKPGVRRFYEEFATSGAHRLQFETERLVVDRNCILTEGIMRMAWPGRTLLTKGIEVDDPQAYYLYEARMAILWPVSEDGLFIGEDTYVGGNGFQGIEGRKIDPSDIAPYGPRAA